MIAKIFGTAAAAMLLMLSVSCSHFSKNRSDTQASQSSQTSQTGRSSSASAGGTGASGPGEMGRGRCEALIGAERDKCFAEDRQRSDAKK